MKLKTVSFNFYILNSKLNKIRKKVGYEKEKGEPRRLCYPSREIKEVGGAIIQHQRKTKNVWL
jgi:hypothetical protein